MFKFSDHLKITDINSVPEPYRGLYDEHEDEDGIKQYSLREDAVALATAYDGQSKSLDEERSKLKDANNESAQRRVTLREYDNLLTDLEINLNEGDNAVDAIRNKFSEITNQIQEGKKINTDLDKIQKDYDKRLREAIDIKDKEISEKDRALSKYLIEKEAVTAINEARGATGLLLPLIKDRAVVQREGDEYVVRIGDEQGDAISDGRGGFMGIREYVDSLKSQEQFARAFESEVPSGGGSPSGASEMGGGKPVPPSKPDEMSSKEKISAGLENL